MAMKANLRNLLIPAITLALVGCHALTTMPAREVPIALVPDDLAVEYLNQASVYRTDYSERCTYRQEGVVVNERWIAPYEKLFFSRHYDNNMITETEILQFTVGTPQGTALCQYSFKDGPVADDDVVTILSKMASALSSLGARYNECQFKLSC